MVLGGNDFIIPVKGIATHICSGRSAHTITRKGEGPFQIKPDLRPRGLAAGLKLLRVFGQSGYQGGVSASEVTGAAWKFSRM